MREGDQLGRIREHLPDRGEFRVPGVGVDPVPDRMLHPRVGRQDEVGADDRAQRRQPDGGEVHVPGQPVPAEDPQAEEGGLQEERDQRFHGQRRAEDISDETRVVRPVHPELELLDDSRDDPHREVDEHQLAPETGQAQPFDVSGPIPRRLHHRDQQRQPNCQRDEQKMIDRGDRKLPARYRFVAHVRCHPAYSWPTSSWLICVPFQ